MESLKEWMNFRKISGEIIDENSWLMRDLWDTQDIQGKGKGLVTRPNKLTSIGIKKLVNRAIWAQGLRKKLESGKKRHPFQAIHCYRKWFKTRCEMAGMKPINVEILLSHNVGISNSYYKPTENESLEDYLKVTNLLSIDKQSKLETVLQEYEEKNKEENYIIKGKLQDREEQIRKLEEKYESSMNKMKEDIENKLEQIMTRIDISGV